MGRKCSHCGKTGHNSRTCSTMKRQVLGCRFRLFGVHVNEPSLSINNHNNLKTMDRLNCNASPSSSSSSSSSTSRLSSTITTTTSVVHRQISNKSGLLNIARAQERKKGVAWSEEEHRMFLIGLEKLGKGDWRGISRNFVTTRTPTQVASHAQKYFLRRNSLFPTASSNRRHSLFDMGIDRHQFTHEMLNYYNANNKTTTILPTTTSLTGLTKLDTTTGNLMDYYSSNQCPILRSNHHQYKPIFNREYSFLHYNNNNSLQPNITSSCYYSNSTTTAKITSFQRSDGISSTQPNLELTLSAPTPQLGQHCLHRLSIT